MANIIYKIPGKLHWTRVYEGQEDDYEGVERYKVTLEPSEEGWAIFNKTGLKLKVRKLVKDDPDSPDVVVFSRKKEPKEFNGKVVFKGGPPVVINADGDEMTSDQLIGNGSEGIIKIMKYVPKSRPSLVGHHLEAIQVTKYIPYEPMEDEEDEAPFDVEETKKGKKKVLF